MVAITRCTVRHEKYVNLCDSPLPFGTDQPLMQKRNAALSLVFGKDALKILCILRMHGRALHKKLHRPRKRALTRKIDIEKIF